MNYEDHDKYCKNCGKKLELTCNRDIDRKNFCSRSCCSKHTATTLKLVPPASKRTRYQKVCSGCEIKISWTAKTGFCKKCSVRVRSDKKRINRFCHYCKKEVSLQKSISSKTSDNRVYCNKKCRSLSFQTSLIGKKREYKCNFCGKVFFRYPSTIKVPDPCCSRSCNSKNIHRKIHAGKTSKLTVRKHIRRLPEYKTWTQKIIKRDNFSCVACGAKRGLHIHHIRRFSQLVADFIKKFCITDKFSNYEIGRLAASYESFWDAGNGRTLCFDCHQLEHPERSLSNKRYRLE